MTGLRVEHRGGNGSARFQTFFENSDTFGTVKRGQRLQMSSNSGYHRGTFSTCQPGEHRRRKHRQVAGHNEHSCSFGLSQGSYDSEQRMSRLKWFKHGFYTGDNHRMVGFGDQKRFYARLLKGFRWIFDERAASQKDSCFVTVHPACGTSGQYCTDGFGLRARVGSSGIMRVHGTSLAP